MCIFQMGLLHFLRTLITTIQLIFFSMEFTYLLEIHLPFHTISTCVRQIEVSFYLTADFQRNYRNCIIEILTYVIIRYWINAAVSTHVTNSYIKIMQPSEKSLFLWNSIFHRKIILVSSSANITSLFVRDLNDHETFIFEYTIFIVRRYESFFISVSYSNDLLFLSGRNHLEMPRMPRVVPDPQIVLENAYELRRENFVQEGMDRQVAADLANSISDSPSKHSDNGSDHDPNSISSKKSSKTKKKKKKSKKRKKRAIVVESSDSSDSSHPSESSVSESDSSSDSSIDI